ncbi:MAG: hypothetical protein WEE89_21160 [Gemmatimonadota bacterium]
MLDRVSAAGFMSALLLAGAAHAGAQPLPLAPTRESGQTVTPVFEGWYKNPDGSYTLSFGYYNRNSREVLEIPVGPSNFLKPGLANRGQPAHFQPRRHWGVFGVRVPANFGEKQLLWWTLIVRGDTLSVPGSLKRGWEIDAIVGEADTGNQPPVLKFEAAGPIGTGPAGIAAAKSLTAVVGQPIDVTVFATDDGKASSGIASPGRAGVPVTLTWFKHQGPGDVAFADNSPAVEASTGKATTAATFSAAGSYILRVRANDATGVAGAGHSQCCWTNGFVKVTVTR